MNISSHNAEVNDSAQYVVFENNQNWHIYYRLKFHSNISMHFGQIDVIAKYNANANGSL